MSTIDTVGHDWRSDVERIRAARPRHVLFLCVANSARSQMAEAIARTLAPPGTRISSAGSRPSHVSPLALRVLAEIGIDAARQYSKSVADIPARDVDVVVTLCAQEVCPAFLGNALRVHWAFPDPAAAGRSEPESLEGFRRVRDQLRRRLELVFAPAD